MAVIKCKMCGDDLILIPGQSVAECPSCTTRQTVPAVDDEKKLTLFARANRLRLNCEFDKAAGVYESIVADFPEEAEAYWGLVLCKYGIEYVTDPATGKKIPTCHRSSFDSIMEDSDFEQALENADAVARKVYREEAKQMEQIRKGIIEVSAHEMPYDIFICYKETDENGQRTLDSVLAQDIYDALSAKGYRTFFARISLEDKLGQEYEPYIFAALNSAKIMLAVGTDYEYYNAVWVKNEWSRFLKLMAKDKTRHLIPCYKGIDAYDMPKEFLRLQAQDLGKMGAIQDILRGVEKLMPGKQSNTAPAEQKAPQTGTGSNKIASLLDRGYMALEDGNWDKADSFFEDVLNNDSRNAQAYLGKTLGLQRCRTLDALVRKRLDSYRIPEAETLYITLTKERSDHIRQMGEECALEGYVRREAITDLYEFDRSYPSLVSGRQAQYQEEESWWQNHKQLSRAEKFATGEVAQQIRQEKKRLFAQLSDRVKKAQEEDSRRVAELAAAYDAHVLQADENARQMHSDALARREKDYQCWLEIAKTGKDAEKLKMAVSFFEAWEDYRDCKNLARHCRKRIADIKAEEKCREAEAKAAAAAEAERARIQAEKEQAARKKKNIRNAILAVVVLIAVIAAGSFVYANFIPKPETQTVINAIIALNGEEMTLERVTELQDAEIMYAALPEKEQKLVSNHNLLLELRAQYDILEQAEVQRIEGLIETLPAPEEIRLASEDLIDDVIWEFSHATEAVQAKVSNADRLTEAVNRMEAWKQECWKQCSNCGGSGKVTCSLCKGRGSREVYHTTPNGKTWLVHQECATTSSCAVCSGRGGVYVEEETAAEDVAMEEEIYEGKRTGNPGEAQVGDWLLFGTNGDKEITWQVLVREDDRILVIMENRFRNMSFQDNQNKPKYYKDSPIRAYLNEEFYVENLSEEEQQLILETELETTGGNVKDKVFLLSDAEAQLYFASDEARVPANGGSWFLRTVNPAGSGNKPIAMYVKADGSIYQNDSTTDYENGIRPAMWIDISSFAWQEIVEGPADELD